LHFKASEKRPQRNPAFISVSKSIVFLVFGCFFWVNEQRSLTLAIFSVSLRKSAHSPSGTEGTRYIGSEGKGCQRRVVVKKEGRKKTRRERKISGVFVFPPQAVTKALIFGFSYLFCYFYFYFLHLSGNFSYFLVTVTNLYIHFI